jgi:hypothetical protein
MKNTRMQCLADVICTDLSPFASRDESPIIEETAHTKQLDCVASTQFKVNEAV